MDKVTRCRQHKKAGTLPAFLCACCAHIVPLFRLFFMHSANASLTVSAKLIDTLKFFEGLAKKRRDGRIEAYLDTNTTPAKPTICWGHTGTAKLGMVVTEAQCVQLKRQDLKEHEDNVKELVDVQLTQGQFDAMVSFCYNIGREKFRRSDVLKMLNQGNTAAVTTELLKWTRAGGRVLPGLVARRKAEIALFEAKDAVLPAEPLAYNRTELQQSLNNPQTLWMRVRALFGA